MTKSVSRKWVQGRQREQQIIEILCIIMKNVEIKIEAQEIKPATLDLH